MLRQSGFFGEHAVLHFDGGLFDDDSIIDLDPSTRNDLQAEFAKLKEILEPKIGDTVTA